jgi:hypothetical protein
MSKKMRLTIHFNIGFLVLAMQLAMATFGVFLTCFTKMVGELF